MPTSERAYYRALRRGHGQLRGVATEIRDARLAAGLSQQTIARALGWSDAKVSRIEAGSSGRLTILDAIVLADAVGLDLSIKAYPGRSPTRDAPQARRLRKFLASVRPPIQYRLEALLPAKESGPPERRAWDAILWDATGDTGVELEQRLYDVQAQTRRVLLKWRDSGVERMLLVIADTRGNRRVIDEFPDYFRELPRLRTANVLKLIEAGIRPPSGFVLF